MDNNNKRRRNRNRAIKAALDYFTSNLPGRFRGRAEAVRQIKDAPRPLTLAKKLVRHHRTQDLEAETAIDFSDVQGIRVKLIMRDHILDQPQAMLLARMDRMIAQGEMDETTFKRMASAAIGMKPALMKDIRKAEAAGNKSFAKLPQDTKFSPKNIASPADMRHHFPEPASASDPCWDIPPLLDRRPKEAPREAA